MPAFCVPTVDLLVQVYLNLAVLFGVLVFKRLLVSLQRSINISLCRFKSNLLSDKLHTHAEILIQKHTSEGSVDTF